MSLSLLWKLMEGDKQVSVQLEAYERSITGNMADIEQRIFRNIDNIIEERISNKINESFRAYRKSNDTYIEQMLKKYEYALQNNEVDKIANKLKEFDNRFNREEEMQQSLQNKIDAIEKYVRNMPKQMSVDDEIVRNIVREEMANFNVSNTTIDENSILNKISALLIPRINSELDKFNRKINNLDDTISSLQNMHIQDQKKISRLEYELEKEKNEKDEFAADIKKYEKEIAGLSDMVEKLQVSISELMAKKTSIEVTDNVTEKKEVEQAADIIEEKKNVDTVVKDEIKDTVRDKKQEEIKILYSSEKKNYHLVLERFISNTEELEEKAKLVYGDSEDGKIIFKLINKCRERFLKLKDKNEENDYDVDKIVSETAKIIKQTIAKALSQKSIRDYIDEYLRKCGIRKIDWQVGKKLDDYDYEYLGEIVLYDSVENKSDDETITEIGQNSYVIDYEEDGNKYEKLIPGIYHIGKYRK